MYVLIFVQLVSEAFLSQEEFKQGVVNELSLSCKLSVILTEIEFGLQIWGKKSTQRNISRKSPL